MIVEALPTICATVPVSASPEFESRYLPAGSKSDIWFTDGNVILVAEGISFKVHRGQLERQSEVFHDLFAIPQPEDAAVIDGCHVVELFDSPSDVWYLLKALYDGLYFKKASVDNFQAVASVLRLSTKYMIEHLRERCLVRLEADWPSTLSGWDSREIEATDSSSRYTPRTFFAHPILVINLAREMSLPHLLPAAFYDLCRYGPSKILAGVATPLPRIGSDKYQPDPITCLPFEELQTVLIGRETTQRVIARFIESELSMRPISSQCHNKDREAGRACRESFYFIMLNILRSVGGVACGRDCDPLYTLTQAVDMLSRTDFSDGTQLCALKICAACKGDFAETTAAAREFVWSQIPEWFGLVGSNGEDQAGMQEAQVAE